MSDTIIRVENLGKKYIIGHQQEGRSQYDTLRDTIANGAKSIVKRFTQPSQVNSNKEEFWALKDVSFEIKQGECVGIIGRNGAGKSTLLKILSRITEPTTGRISIKGRVASLLEVGTGFHPELTGRENIYLNGAILGMSRVEIKKKFDEIVAFAEVEKFLDTPVKRYSSGMYVRLAFAVAAHLEPEILIVDEVLAVGDAAFQKKCLGKMGDVATKEGRTVLFVSHNMAAIQGLCNQAFLLNQGSLTFQGEITDVINQYLNNNEFGSQESTIDLQNHQGRKAGSAIIFKEAEIFCDGIKTTTLKMGGSLKLVIYFNSKTAITNMRFGISIEDYSGQRIVNFSPTHQCPNLITGGIFAGIITCEISSMPLLPRPHFITLITGNAHKNLDQIDKAIQLDIESSDVFSTGYTPNHRHGFFFVPSNWTIQKIS